MQKIVCVERLSQFLHVALVKAVGVGNAFVELSQDITFWLLSYVSCPKNSTIV